MKERSANSMGAADSDLTSRVIGSVVGLQPGPTLILIGGLHGNEPAGIAAQRRVFARLEQLALRLHGELTGLAGNLGALAQHKRYLQKDLNRLWTASPRARSGAGGSAAVPALQSYLAMDPDALQAEDREQLELAQALERVLADARELICVVDLHTTSSSGPPFLVMPDTLLNRDLARRLPLSIVFGLEEHLDGTISEYLTSRGLVSLTVESGQHQSPTAVDNAEAAIWILLAAMRMLDADNALVAEMVSTARQRLRRESRSLPRSLQVLHRHTVHPRDEFRMQPGFRNFDRIEVGQQLASDRGGPIRSRWRGRLLMPLYQSLGADGFFVVREFKPLWLKVSSLLRRLHVDSLAHLLPGVRRHPKWPDTLVINRRVARWNTLEVLHLLGFRRIRNVGGVLLVSRRGPGRAASTKAARHSKEDRGRP